MSKRTLSANVGGRVKKVKTKDFLVPLFEALSNSIQAIEAAGRPPNGITIEVLRRPRQQDFQSDQPGYVAPITGFIVTDDGVGFTRANLDSFAEADSTYKEHLGGKGVGRFTWLKFFESATVDSVFEEGGKRFRRVFDFSRAGIDEKELVEVVSQPLTSVTVSPLIVSYESRSAKAMEDVAIEIIEHFIAYFVTGAMPRLLLKDGAATQDVVDLYQKSIGRNSSKKQFSINGQAFTATGIKFYLGGQGHVAFLCANRRAAEKILLGKQDPFFSRRFQDEGLRHYAFHIFVQSKYLDAPDGIVNDDRDGFSFPERGSLGAMEDGAVTKEQLIEQILILAHSEMAPQIEALKKSNIETVRAFVSTDAPQYRYLVEKHQGTIASFHETDKIKLDQALRRLQFEEETTTRIETAALMRKAEQVGGSAKEEWRRKSAEVLARLNEEGKANLASYIVQRRLILDLLQKKMEVSDGNHAREEAIHQLIFPMRTTSDDVGYEEQNLWIIDERLAYHYYLASDKQLASMPPAESSSHKEPDLIVFNRPIALNDQPEGGRFESIVIVEFKRPGETAVEGKKNPVDQILDYIDKILEGRAETHRGRPIRPTEGLYFFGYAICEVDAPLKKALTRFNMGVTPDGRGLFGFFKDHRAYIEVISYDKMLDDAMKRNRILFEKLQVPSRRS